LGNATASRLAILPCFAVLSYYQKQELFDVQHLQYKYCRGFSHAAYLCFLVFIREMVKDLENLTGDFANNYRTIPVVYGEKTSKYIITALIVLSLIPVYILVEIADVGYMDIYFYFSLIGLLFFLLFLWRADEKKHFMAS